MMRASCCAAPRLALCTAEMASSTDTCRPTFLRSRSSKQDVCCWLSCACAVVVVSMCASAGEAPTRGLEFLFDQHRLNVALSRSQCLSIVVGDPGLTRFECNTVAQMRLLNLYCRICREGSVGFART